MIGGLLLLTVSLALVVFAGLNLRSCIRTGVSSAYGHAICRSERPIAFWISASCSGLALLLGAIVAFAVLVSLIAD